MLKPSTKNLQYLPKPDQFQQLCKSISALEAILCPEWEYRYYSYNKNWSESEEFCEMRNGTGDHMLILFHKSGIVINGFAHESKMNGWRLNDSKKEYQGIWPGLVDKLPDSFTEFIFGEPVKSIGTTFCIWCLNDHKNWQIGDFEYLDNSYKDGSEDLLELLDGNPKTYWDWAMDTYEIENLDLEIIKAVYHNTPISLEMIHQLNPELGDLESLKSDLDEIGYDHNL